MLLAGDSKHPINGSGHKLNSGSGTYVGAKLHRYTCTGAHQADGERGKVLLNGLVGTACMIGLRLLSERSEVRILPRAL
jgi:hypothetical protein